MRLSAIQVSILGFGALLLHSGNVYANPTGSAPSNIVISVSQATVDIPGCFEVFVTVSPGSSGEPTPTGMVEIEDTSTGLILGTGFLDRSGSATLTVSSLGLPVGGHGIVGIYQGDSLFNISQSHIFLETVIDTGSGPSGVPKPTSLALLGVGLTGLIYVRRRRRHARARNILA